MISILLATYNGEKYILESIESILNQTYTNFELLVGFNGTTDNSKKLVRNFGDNRIRIFDYGSDRGKAKTLNKLLLESKYDWLSIQDDDDIWIENKLEKQIEFMSEFDVIGTFIKYIDPNGSISGSPNLKTESSEIKNLSLVGINQIANTSTLFRKSSTLEIGGWREDIDGIEDYDFWLRLMRIGKKFINIPEYLVLHRIHNQSNFNTKNHDISKIL